MTIEKLVKRVNNSDNWHSFRVYFERSSATMAGDDALVNFKLIVSFFRSEVIEYIDLLCLEMWARNRDK